MYNHYVSTKTFKKKQNKKLPLGKFPKFPHLAHSQTQISRMPVGARPLPGIVFPSILAFG